MILWWVLKVTCRCGSITGAVGGPAVCCGGQGVAWREAFFGYLSKKERNLASTVTALSCTWIFTLIEASWRDFTINRSPLSSTCTW
jgi:hypothetical protein